MLSTLEPESAHTVLFQLEPCCLSLHPYTKEEADAGLPRGLGGRARHDVRVWSGGAYVGPSEYLSAAADDARAAYRAKQQAEADENPSSDDGRGRPTGYIPFSLITHIHSKPLFLESSIIA